MCIFPADAINNVNNEMKLAHRFDDGFASNETKPAIHTSFFYELTCTVLNVMLTNRRVCFFFFFKLPRKIII